MGVVGFIDLFAPFQFLLESPPWVSFFVPGLVLVAALLVLFVLTAANVAVGLVLAVYVVIAWIGGTLVTLSMVFNHAGVHDIFFQGLLVILGLMSNTVVASVVFGLVLGAIAKWAERSEREEPVEAVESERVKTYPPYEKTP
jgi:hypothetical protein